MNLPPYTIKRSPRARHVRFRVTAADGLCVTIPRGFDPAGVAELVAEKQAWYEKVFRELVEKAPPPIPTDFFPEKLDLTALGENWHVSYQDGKERGRLLTNHDGFALTYFATNHSQERVFAVLRRWLNTRAKTVLVPQAFALAKELGFEIKRVTIRNQRSRWGSCTSKKTLSLNLKLLFLEPEQLRHVLVHELCHTVHLNHSSDFWSLVAKHEPDYKTMNKTMKTTWRQVPQWV